ncbi:MAG TPA: RDD family protein [Nevskiaceae bacterium]|nr:RDD family protein [Nevskiaceae bacterium]
MSEPHIELSTIDAVEVRLDLAGAGSRAYAFLVDWHIRAVAAIVVGVGLFYAIRQVAGDGPIGPTPYFVGAAIYLLYHPVLEIAQRGLTPGKRFARIRIVMRDGSPPTFGALLVRNLFRLVDSLPMFYALGLLVMMVTHRPSRIGDLAAGTLVVHAATQGTGIDAAARLSERVPVHTQQLLEEWLARWKELDAGVRDDIARRLLGDGPFAAPPGLRGAALRDHVRRLLAA